MHTRRLAGLGCRDACVFPPLAAPASAAHGMIAAASQLEVTTTTRTVAVARHHRQILSCTDPSDDQQILRRPMHGNQMPPGGHAGKSGPRTTGVAGVARMRGRGWRDNDVGRE